MRWCPLCRKRIRSDAALREYCAMCGMGIAARGFVVRKEGVKTRFFCAKVCYQQYRKSRVVEDEVIVYTG